MADEHAGEGGSPYTFLFLLVGAMIAALVFKAIHTGIPLTASLQGKPVDTAAMSSAPIVTATTTPAVSTHPRKRRAALPPQDHWITITLDQDGRVMSIVHY